MIGGITGLILDRSHCGTCQRRRCPIDAVKTDPALPGAVM